MRDEKQKPIAISLLCVICEREHNEKVRAVLEAGKSFFSLAMLGKGTASSRIRAYVGLGESEKQLYLAILPAGPARQLVEQIDDVMNLKKPGHGIAFTASIQEGCYHVPVHFTGQDAGGDRVENKTMYDLVVVIMNRGYTEEVMAVARKAGATGGTVLHARGVGLGGADKFFGVTIQPEKELIMIVAEAAASAEIMAAMAQQVGPESDADAVSFSMPLDAVRGIGGAVPQGLL